MFVGSHEMKVKDEDNQSGKEAFKRDYSIDY
jgi:hypothetical protein